MVGQGMPTDQAKRQADQVNSLFYFCNQPFVGAAIYYGIIFVFLFVLGLVLVQNKWKWWLASAALFMLTVSWGKNFFLNDILFDYFPLFNKFRAVTQALGLGQLSVVALAMLGLQAWFDETIAPAKKMRALYIATGVVGVFCLTALAGGDATGPHDSQLQPQLLSLVKEDRADLARNDGFRSIGFMLLAAALLYSSLKGYIKKTWIAVAAIGFICLADIWMVDKRIVSPDKFQTAQEAKANTRKDNPTEADKKILEDKDPDFRVFDLAGGDPFQDANTSFLHKSIGGYHAAKLMRYQELAEKYLYKFDPDKKIIDPSVIKIFSMLNTKYFILGRGDKKEDAVLNPDANGNAWFVKNIQTVEDADAELETLANINPKETALISKPYLGVLQGFTPQYDSANYIKLTSYNPEKMEYEYSAKSDQLAVFSEIYYPAAKGWNLYLNGQPIAPFTKADYTLRAAKLPAGEKQHLEMRFEPKSFYTGETISMVASGLLLLLIAAGLFLYFKNEGFPNVDRLPEEWVVATVASKSVKPIKASAPLPPTEKGGTQRQIKRKNK